MNFISKYIHRQEILLISIYWIGYSLNLEDKRNLRQVTLKEKELEASTPNDEGFDENLLDNELLGTKVSYNKSLKILKQVQEKDESNPYHYLTYQANIEGELF